MSWRGLVFIDSHGQVWEITPDHPEPRKVTQQMVDADIELTDADREWLAEIKVAV